MVSKTETAYAAPKLAQFGKLTSSLAFDFFLPLSFSFGQREIASVPFRIPKLYCIQKREDSEGLLRSSLTGGVEIGVEGAGRPHTVLVSFLFSGKKN